MKTQKIISAFAAISALTLLLTGCGSTGSNNTTSSAETSKEEARQITVALAPGFYPITYADDNGEAAGYDVEVFRAIDELLPQYEFVFDIVDKETMNVGVETGTYQVGINSMFKTPQREEIYLLPETNMGYTAVAGLYREGEAAINSFQDVYDQGLKIYPTTASGTIQNVISNWNDAHPDAVLEFEIESSTDNSEAINSVRSGEYDFFIHLLPVINLWGDELKAGLEISGALDVVPTYPIINKEETQLNADVNEALGKLKESGKLSEISLATFEYDVFELAR